MNPIWIRFFSIALGLCVLAPDLRGQDAEWEKYTTLFIELHQQGRYEEADVFAKKAMDWAQRHYGPEHPNTLTSMNNMAVNYEEQGKSDKAQTLHEETLALRRKVLGDRHPDTLESLNNLALLYFGQGKFKEAQSFYEEGLFLGKQVLGLKHRTTLAFMNNLAMLYESQGKYDKAQPLHEETLALRRKALGDRHTDTLESLNNLALLYFGQGRYEKAYPIYEESVSLSRQILGPKHPRTLGFMNNLAVLHKKQGKYEKAQALFEEILISTKEQFGLKHPQIFMCVNNLALLYELQGRSEKARPMFEQTMILGKQLLGPRHPDVLLCMNNLAMLYTKERMYEKAQLLFEEALTLTEQALGPKHPTILMLMNNLASLYDRQEKREKARPMFEQTMILGKQLLGPRHPDVLLCMNNLAMLYTKERMYEKAQLLFEETLTLAEQVLAPQHPTILMLMNNLAKLYEAQEKYDQARVLWRDLLIQGNQAFHRWFWSVDEKTRASYLKTHGCSDNLLYFVNEMKDAGMALHFSLTRKGILLRTSSEINAVRSLTKDEGLQKTAGELQKKRSELSRISLSETTTEKDKATLSRLEEEIERCEQELAQKSEPYASRRTVSLEKVLSRLGKDEAIVDFLTFQMGQTDYLMAVVIDPVTHPGGILLPIPDFGEIEKRIQKYRTLVVGPDARSFHILEETAQDLYRRLWKPLGKYVAGKKRIYLCLDGSLHLLPFGALLDERKKHLIETVELVTISSLPDLARKRATKNVRKGAPVVLGDPDYGKPSSEEGKSLAHDLFFSRLPGSREEAQAVSRLLEEKGAKCNVYLGKEARVERIKRLVSPRILHLATHGYFLDDLSGAEGSRGVLGIQRMEKDLSAPLPGKEDAAKSSQAPKPLQISNPAGAESECLNPLQRCGLAFAGANAGAENLLSASEAVTLDLYGTELVVLSACDTGVGRVKQGEGVFSLRRAFEEAGAEAVLCTLWPTEDHATKIFMQKFYAKYLDGIPAQVALRETQLEFISDKKYRHPFYWAQFVMAGIPAPFVPGRRKDRGYAITAGAFLFFLSALGCFWYYHRKKQASLRQKREERRKRRKGITGTYESRPV